MHNVITLLRNEKIYQEADMERVTGQEFYVGNRHTDSPREYKYKRIQDKLRFIAEIDKAIQILTIAQEAL